MPAIISRRLLGRAVATRLTGVTNATGYYGQIGARNGLDPTVAAPADPPAKSPTDPRAAAYFIVFPGAGAPGGEDSLDETVVDLDWPVQITAAGGDTDDVLALVDRIDALLYRWAPATTNGVICGPLRTPPGYSPLLFPDDAQNPRRFFVPLQYQLTAHT